MRNILVGAAVAALVFVAAGFAYSARTTARSTAVTPAQFRALQARVKKLETATGALAAYTVNCLFHWAGVARFGQPPSNGYVFDNDNNPSNGQALASALDVTDPGETPTAYFNATTDRNCLPTGAALSRRLHVLRAGTASRHSVRVTVRQLSAPYGAK